MDASLLVDAIARQTTVLIAQLSASAGLRAPLAHVVDQVFLTLSEELESQGLSRKVVADMFGMALRTYQRRVQRLREGARDRRITLWQSVIEHLQKQGPVTRRELFERFRTEDPESVGAVLADLLNSGLCYKTGSSSNVVYGITPEEDRKSIARSGKLEAATALLWLEICRNPGLTEDALADQMGLEAPVCAAALSGLLQQQRVTRDDAGRLSATSMVIPVGAEHGWEVAVFDHFQAVCAAIIAKLRQGQTQSGARDTTGGTTLTYDVTEDHPLAGRVLELMARVRSEANALWHEVEAHNAKRPISEKDLLQVTFYCGQALKSPKEPPA